PGLADRDQVAGAGPGELGEAPLRLVAVDVILLAAAIDALGAAVADVAPLAGRNKHALARGKSLDASAQLGDHSGDFTAADVRHRNLGRQSLADPQVEVVEGAGLDLDDDFTVAGRRFRQVHQLQLVDTARFGERHCTHIVSPVGPACRAGPGNVDGCCSNVL